MGIETKYYTTGNEPKSLDITSAAVGQIPKVKAVDSNGRPTEWEPVALSSDMFYVLDMVDGEGDTYTINNNFDEAVSAIDQGKVFIYKGGCLLASYNTDEGTAKSIDLGIVKALGHTMWWEWNRGNSTVTSKLNLFPIIDSGTITTTGVVYYDGSFKIKSEASASGAIYIIKFSDGVLVNDYTELENAVKEHKIIVEGSNSDIYLICVMASYDENSISLSFQYSNLMLQSRIAQGTKKVITSTYVIPSIEADEGLSSQSGSIYYDKITNSFSIKDITPPTASTSTAGTIKVGNGLSISDDGTLSVTTATYYTGTSDPVDTLGADGDLYLKTEV